MVPLTGQPTDIMLKNVRLRLLPTTYNCLAWSPEGSLALIAGEHVVILVAIAHIY